MSIRRKLHIALGSGLLLTLVLAGASWWSAGSAQSAIQALVEESSRAEELAMDLALTAEKALSAERAIVVRATLADREGMQSLDAIYRQARVALGEHMAELRRKTAVIPAGRNSTLDEIEAIAGTWDASHRRFWDAARELKVEESAKLMRAELVPLAAGLSGKTAKLFQIERKAMQDASNAAGASGQRHALATLALALLALSAAIGGFWATNQGMSQLADSLTDMRRMAEEVTQAAGSVSGTSQALASGATRQAASTEETAASATEVKSMAERNSQSARAAAKIVNDSEEKFEQANLSLSRMEETMAGIAASAAKIARIIKVIDDIAFQTNILSLNAAVEAARAGDAGLGFAVVADEVRTLAQRCATAAQETAALINESIARSSEGKLAATEVAGTIRVITEETNSIRSLVEEVSAGSSDQARAIDQISSAIMQIETVTQDSAANAQEAAAASEELTAQSAELRLIAQRITELTGTHAASAPAPPAPRSPAPRSVAPPKPSAAPRPPAPSAPRAPSAAPTRYQPSSVAADDDDQDFRPF